MEHFLFALVLIDDILKQAITTFFEHCTPYEKKTLYPVLPGTPPLKIYF